MQQLSFLVDQWCLRLSWAAATGLYSGYTGVGPLCAIGLHVAQTCTALTYFSGPGWLLYTMVPPPSPLRILGETTSRSGQGGTDGWYFNSKYMYDDK